MKKTSINIIRCVFFFILLLGIFIYLSKVFTTSKVEEYPVRNGFFQNIDAENDNTIDNLFIGDSSVMHSIIPVQLWKEQKMTSYVMSYSVMKPQEAYFDLKKVFKKQSPKYVFIESQFMVKYTKDSNKYLTDKTQNLCDYGDDQITGEISYYVPVMKYKSSWSNTRLSDLKLSHPSTINSIYKGYKYAPEVQAFTSEHGCDDNGKIKFKDSGYEYFKKIYNMCKEHNCEVVLMNMPQGTTWNKEMHNFVQKLADEFDVKYIDFDVNLDKLIPTFSWNTDTKDGGGHLNYSGATKLTKSIEKFMINELHIQQTKLSQKDVDKWNKDTKDFYNSIK